MSSRSAEADRARGSTLAPARIDEDAYDWIAARLLSHVSDLRHRTSSMPPPVHLSTVETYADVVTGPRFRLPISPGPSELFVGAIGPGWCELTDQPTAAHLRMPAVRLGNKELFRLPQGVVRTQWRRLPDPTWQAFVAVRRLTGGVALAPWVVVAAVTRVLTVLSTDHRDLELFCDPAWPPLLDS